MAARLGVTQLAVLRAVGAEPRTVAELAARIYGDSFTDSQRRGVARAVASLSGRGLVEARLGASRFREVRGPLRVQRVDPALLEALEWPVPTPRTVRRVPIVETFVRSA